MPVIALIQFCTYLVTIIAPRGSVRVRSGLGVRVGASYSTVIALIQYYTALWVG